jgi:CubicO group peptidase (beta-lactamase class C family)
MIKNVLAGGLILLVLQSCHVGRFFIYNFADSRDYKKFPEKEIHRSANPSYFTDATSLNLVKLPEKIEGLGKTYTFKNAIRKTGTIAFIIIRNDSILYQWYRPRRSRSSLTSSFSMSKSFLSALVGIAIDEAYIKSTNEPITNYIDFADKKALEKVTIQHLLDMQSGIKFNEIYFNPFGDIAKYYYGTNLKKYIRKLKSETEPGQKFRYISVNTQLLGMVLEKAIGKSLTEYMQEKLWEPLGMEFDASWSIDSKKHGTEKAFCCINGRAIDYAKLGAVYANKGKWKNKQIVPEKWVEEVTHFKNVKNHFLYSNHWWHTRDYLPAKDSAKVKKPYYYVMEKDKSVPLIATPSGDLFAQGLLGQYLYVYPEKKLVIVRISKREGRKIHWASVLKMIARMN